MRVLLAPDCFSGTMTAPEAAAAMATGWLRSDPAAELSLAPMSDGGPGFVAVLAERVDGRVVEVDVTGPLGGTVPGVLLLGDDGTAYVEAASACGLAYVPASERDAVRASTEGVGELLRAALDLGATRVVVGVGGTATTDGGRGCVTRLGGSTAWPAGVELVVATDVDNPLLGSNGAAAVYGPQKGANRDQVRELEERLTHWAAETGGGSGAATAPGAGAGGGLGYGLMLLGGHRASGVQTVVEVLRLEERARAVDLLVTGEGSFDATSLQGAQGHRLGRAARGAAVRRHRWPGARRASGVRGRRHRCGVLDRGVGRFARGGPGRAGRPPRRPRRARRPQLDPEGLSGLRGRVCHHGWAGQEHDAGRRCWSR
jgi:glycerate kinase